MSSSSGDTAREVYVFDRPTLNKIRVVPDTGASPLRIYAYADYTYFRVHQTRFQVIAIGLSLLKLTETMVLVSYDAALLAAITTLPWAYFFIVAVILEIHEIRLGRKPELEEGEMDILTGTLPTVTQPGGPKKIILGMVGNPRHTVWWGLLWGIGALLCTFCLVMTYFIMGQQNQGVSFLWLCFQLVWTLARMILQYFAEIEDPHGHRSFSEKMEDRRPKSWRHRVLRLTASLAKYQMLLHPRGEKAYKNDCFSAEDLSLLSLGSILDLFPLSAEQKSVNVDMVRVVGDPFLSSAAWIVGSKITPMDVYDCCVVTFSINVDGESGSRMISIPAARVYSYTPTTPDGEDSVAFREYVPKGAPNPGTRMFWWYFIPATHDKWLVVRRASELGLGKSEGRVMTNSELAGQLLSGELHVDIRDVGDIQKVVNSSRSVLKFCLLQLL